MPKIKVEPTVIPYDQHNISRSSISDNALKVLNRLKNAGYEAYLVGGGVRDILLGEKPKDFDVVTDAEPSQIKNLFRNCRLIGRRFRLAHVRFGNEIIEVSTFRAPHHISDENAGSMEDGRIIRDNVYGDIDDDVWRRDFTVNALFYNIKDFSIVDYVGGIDDLNNKQLKLIGDPKKRYVEDPVRLLRVIRFAVKLNLTIEDETEKYITQYAPLLKNIPPARLFEEMLKLFMNGFALKTFALLRHYDLFKYLFPQTDKFLKNKENVSSSLVKQVLKNTDQRLAEGNSVTPGFLLAAFLWEPMQVIANAHMAQQLPEMEAVKLASNTVISEQSLSLAMPKRFTHMVRDIWTLQIRLKKIKKQPYRTLMHPKFRAAYDFLLIRTQTGEPLQELVDYWTKQQVDTPLAQKNEGKFNSYKPYSKKHHQNRQNQSSES